MRWRIFAHPNAISKNVYSVAVARLRVFTQPRPLASFRYRQLTQCERLLDHLVGNGEKATRDLDHPFLHFDLGPRQHVPNTEPALCSCCLGTPQPLPQFTELGIGYVRVASLSLDVRGLDHRTPLV
jgi:hypothetical protein